MELPFPKYPLRPSTPNFRELVGGTLKGVLENFALVNGSKDPQT